MNPILEKIKDLFHSNLKLYLPHVKNRNLENKGEIFYMNGKNGTEFDWYVNDKLPPFMSFYNDKENLGALKLLLYKDGETEIYIYDEKGKKLIKELNIHLDVAESDLLALAVLLRNEADDRCIWDAGIERINTDVRVSDEKIQEFKENKKFYDAMKNRKLILNLTAFVSQKITQEGWKVGYMERRAPVHEEDSGWFFWAGNETDEYTSDIGNIELLKTGAVWQYLDPDIFQYIDLPVGTRLIRISADTFETDKNDREIFMVKRQ